MKICEMGIAEMGVGKMGQIIGETGVCEMGQAISAIDALCEFIFLSVAYPKKNYALRIRLTK